MTWKGGVHDGVLDELQHNAVGKASVKAAGAVDGVGNALHERCIRYYGLKFIFRSFIRQPGQRIPIAVGSQGVVDYTKANLGPLQLCK